MLTIPFPYATPKDDTKSFYLSYLIRAYIIKGDSSYTPKITKQVFYKTMKEQGFNKSRITETWKYKKVGVFMKYVNEDFIVLNGKENVQGEKGFMIRIEEPIDGFYKFQQFVSETYMLRPVTQKNEFYDTFKFKKKATKYNEEVFKRSLEKKIGRGQRKIAEQSGCCLKTVNNRAKRSTEVKVIKRYSESYGTRVRKTNLYFNLSNKVYYYYNKSNTKMRRRYSLSLVHNSLLVNALFLNKSLGLGNAYDDIYKQVPNLGITL